MRSSLAGLKLGKRGDAEIPVEPQHLVWMETRRRQPLDRFDGM
jgi:hypothetical protein